MSDGQLFLASILFGAACSTMGSLAFLAYQGRLYNQERKRELAERAEREVSVAEAVSREWAARRGVGGFNGLDDR